MSNERSMSGSRPYRSIVNAAVLCTLIILACATAGVCPQGCVSVLGNATARLRSRLSKPCDINATVTELRPSGSGFRQKSPKGLSTLPPRRDANGTVRLAEALLAVLIVEQAFQTLELLGDLALARDQGEHVDDQDQPSGQEAVKHECEIACVHLISVK